MTGKKNKLPPITPDQPKAPLDEALPKGEMHFPPSRMNSDGGWVGNPPEHANPLQKKEKR